MIPGWRGLRFLQLCVFVMALLFLLPLLVKYRLAAVVAQVLILNGILVAVSATRRSVTRRLLIAAWMINILVQAVAVFRPSGALSLVAEAAGTAIILLSVWAILAYVFRDREITVDTFFAAITAYLFLAIAFGRVYGIAEVAAPGSFGLRPGVDRGIELLYFSFVTIATLGYGDVLPLRPGVQMLAVLEAVVGQFYVAVIIAWLVSVHAGRRSGT
jgi:hypothetical protein